MKKIAQTKRIISGFYYGIYFSFEEFKLKEIGQ